MRKYILIVTFSLIAILGGILIFLSTVGIKTNKFNNLINDKVKQFNSDLSLNVNEVFLKLDISKRILKINTNDPKISIANQVLDLSNIEINLDLIKFLNNTNSVIEIKITSKENSIKDLTNFLNSYSFNLPRLIIYNQIEKGNIKVLAKIIPDRENQEKFKYKIKGKITDASLNILDKTKVQNINFNFEIEDQNLELTKLDFKFNEIKFLSDKIKINKIDKNFEVDGDLNTQDGLISAKDIKRFTNINLDFLENKFISGTTKNKFSFSVDKERKIKNLNLESAINFDKIYFDKKFQELIFLKNGEINAYYNNKNLNIKINSQYQFINNKYNNKNQKDKINFNITRQKNNDFEIEVLFKNKKNTISSSEIKNYLKLSKNLALEEQNLTFGSDNKINFNIDKNLNIKNVKVKSKIDINKLILNFKSKRAQKYFTNFKNQINFLNNKININYKKNKLDFDIFGKYSLEDDLENFKINIKQNRESLFFNTEIETKKIAIELNEIEYRKEKNIFSKIKLIGEYKKNKEIKFDEITFLEGENKFFIKNLQLTKNDKIKNIDNLNLNYINNSKMKNDINFSKDKNNYVLKGNIFDGSKSIEKLLKDNGSVNSLLNNFSNLNTIINFELIKYYVDKNSYLKTLNGKLFVKNNKIISGNASALLNGNSKFSLNIKTNSNNEKITNLFINKPEPFIKKYKFIKGFKEGSLSYDSINKNNISISKLQINDFKIQKVPVLAKLLTLASLQGIADILTGEGIRFDEFEMDYENLDGTTTVKEMYAIGPAISILMEGYIAKDELTSLRGTLVPATTINKVIAKIPLLGNILVGKKLGEGVFGVSFKIKGPPKNLKTTVNPVKTLTPRFITRTLEKLKKN